jgi:integrase/recombinase XerD
MIFSTALDDFLSYIASEKGLAQRTIEAYGRDISAFLAFAEKNGKTNAAFLIKEDCIAFFQVLHKQGYASSSLARALISIKVFFRFLKKERLIQADPTLFLDTP